MTNRQLNSYDDIVAAENVKPNDSTKEIWLSSPCTKPDITAPGVEILAAFSPAASPSLVREDTRKVSYSILSGTSMSCPHVTGAAGYVKSLHPNWSPSAIKSALMTTARPMNATRNPDAEFAYGVGFIDPVNAANPGLVYETTQDEYLTLFCKLNYTNQDIIAISGNKSFSCPRNSGGSLPPKDVNYPTLTASVKARKPFQLKFSRTVTNVGVANSTYTAEVESASTDTKVTVNPKSLSFKSLNEKKSFDVIVVGKGLAAGSRSSASLVWSDGIHAARSPVVVYSPLE